MLAAPGLLSCWRFDAFVERFGVDGDSDGGTLGLDDMPWPADMPDEEPAWFAMSKCEPLSAGVDWPSSSPPPVTAELLSPFGSVLLIRVSSGS